VSQLADLSSLYKSDLFTLFQRRLRHLRSIAARNVVNKNGFHLLDTYFSLHLCDDMKIFKAFYTSEVIKDSLNPTWRSLDFGLMPDHLDTSVSCIVVRIWGGKMGQYCLLIEWKVNLDGLKYLGQQVILVYFCVYLEELHHMPLFT
uniref:C2 domain-containing protein n=1 Tax=Callorhinchus milii TaxID=7868 RepID=A0A4W3HS70_CALMI